MNDDRPLSADRVPTLTEVVELGLLADPLSPEGTGLMSDNEPPEPVEFSLDMPAQGDADGPEAAAVDSPPGLPVELSFAPVLVPEPEPEPEPEVPQPVAATPAPAPPEVDVEALVVRVLGELTPRIDMLLESRLREALAPALARAADGLIRDTRTNLSGAVRELVQEAVARALQRRSDL